MYQPFGKIWHDRNNSEYSGQYKTSHTIINTILVKCVLTQLWKCYGMAFAMFMDVLNKTICNASILRVKWKVL
jgi:hypothetical protein